MVEVRKRVRLPHWDADDATYFVTFNLHDAFPRDYRERVDRERHIRMTELERLKGKANAAELHEIERLIRERAEECSIMAPARRTCAIRGSRPSSPTQSRTLTHWGWVRVYTERL
jgi:hypothetical protein